MDHHQSLRLEESTDQLGFTRKQHSQVNYLGVGSHQFCHFWVDTNEGQEVPHKEEQGQHDEGTNQDDEEGTMAVAREQLIVGSSVSLRA